MSVKTAVVILNWNGKAFLEKFLPNVIRHSSTDAEIIVADNASGDDSVSFIRSNFPSVRIIINEKNEGFTGGYNIALKQVEADYFVLLNSDVEVSKDWLKPLIALMEKDKSIAACQPKIIAYNDRSEFEYAGAGGGFIDKLGYPFCRGRIFNTLEKDKGQYNDTIDVFWATGACMFVRASVYRELGGLDENFFAHMEEIDLCWRMHRKGYRVCYCGQSEVYHVGGGTLAKNNPRKTYLNFRNNLLMIYKNSGNRKGSILRKRMFFDFVAACKFLITNGFDDFKAVFRAHIDFRKMKKLYPDADEHKLNAFENSTIYTRSILLDYYFYNRKSFIDLNWTS
ncbi:MAG: glycosyltransferase family 2 protein [Bacteroidia bacterium]